jgi:hypothetical protein
MNSAENAECTQFNPKHLHKGIILEIQFKTRMTTELMMSQIPKPPRQDVYKLINKEKTVLRFSCCMVEGPVSQLSQTDR